METNTCICLIQEFTKTENILLVFKAEHKSIGNYQFYSVKLALSINIHNAGKHFEQLKKLEG